MECSAGSEEWQRNTILTKNTLDMTQPCFCWSRRQAPTELDQPHLQQKRNAQTCRDKMSVKWTLVVWWAFRVGNPRTWILFQRKGLSIQHMGNFCPKNTRVFLAEKTRRFFLMKICVFCKHKTHTSHIH
jgi:hypothetical protein